MAYVTNGDKKRNYFIIQLVGKNICSGHPRIHSTIHLEGKQQQIAYMAKVDIVFILERVQFVLLDFDDLCGEVLVSQSCSYFISYEITIYVQIIYPDYRYAEGETHLNACS